MSTGPDDDQIAKWREEEIERLSRLPDFPERPTEENGVLLSDRIRRYCKEYQLIWPFDEDKLLKPAAYDLTVGRNYSKLGNIEALSEGKDLEIGPYQVAIIETYETLNLPEFLIGRWNIRIKLAYKGLLWVGGAQVDPGFRGHLCCPVYNLSTELVRLHFRDELASIDFVTTTPYEEGPCKRFDWRNRKNGVVFPQYPVLRSGIEKQVEEFKQIIKLEKEEHARQLSDAEKNTQVEFRNISSRVDNFVTLTFGVVAVLFAALGITATRASEQLSFLNSPVWVAGIALWFALRAYMERSPKEQPSGAHCSWMASGILALTITAAVVAGSIFLDTYKAHVLAGEIERAREQASKAASALEGDLSASVHDAG
jgi:deoxycytidine triphosphate deaminase